MKLKTQPPVKELLFKTTEHNPTIITVSNAPVGSWLFVYSERTNTCFGSAKVEYESPIPTPILAFGADRWDDGFEVNEEIKLGLYKDNEFYDVNCNFINYFTKAQSETIKWAPLAIYTCDIITIKDNINLDANEELYKSQIDLELFKNNITAGDNLFIKAHGSNVSDITLITNGSGELKPVDRWMNGFGYYDYIYTSTTEDTHVYFNAIAFDFYDKSMVSNQVTATINKVASQPEDKIITIYSNDYLRIEKRTNHNDVFKGYFIVNLSDKPIWYRIRLYDDKYERYLYSQRWVTSENRFAGKEYPEIVLLTTKIGNEMIDLNEILVDGGNVIDYIPENQNKPLPIEDEEDDDDNTSEDPIENTDVVLYESDIIKLVARQKSNGKLSLYAISSNESVSLQLLLSRDSGRKSRNSKNLNPNTESVIAPYDLNGKLTEIVIEKINTTRPNIKINV